MLRLSLDDGLWSEVGMLTSFILRSTSPPPPSFHTPGGHPGPQPFISSAGGGYDWLSPMLRLSLDDGLWSEVCVVQPIILLLHHLPCFLSTTHKFPFCSRQVQLQLPESSQAC